MNLDEDHDRYSPLSSTHVPANDSDNYYNHNTNAQVNDHEHATLRNTPSAAAAVSSTPFAGCYTDAPSTVNYSANTNSNSDSDSYDHDGLSALEVALDVAKLAEVYPGMLRAHREVCTYLLLSPLLYVLFVWSPTLSSGIEMRMSPAHHYNTILSSSFPKH
jgi:hypothetical protein